MAIENNENDDPVGGDDHDSLHFVVKDCVVEGSLDHPSYQFKKDYELLTWNITVIPGTSNSVLWSGYNIHWDCVTGDVMNRIEGPQIENLKVIVNGVQMLHIEMGSIRIEMEPYVRLALGYDLEEDGELAGGG